MDLCLPSKVYLVLALIALIMSFMKSSWGGIIFQIIFVLFWTWIIQLICNSGYTIIAWLIVFAPILLKILGFF